MALAEPDTCAFSNKEYKLFVDNLPQELNEAGIKDIFTHYGRITGFFSRHGASWAFVTYESYAAAESALRDLNDKPPLRLKVSFAKEKGSSNKQEIKWQVPNTYETPPEECVQNFKPFAQTIDRGQLLNAVSKVQNSVQFPNVAYKTDDDLLYTPPNDPHTYNPYQNSERFTDTNALWTRGQLSVTQDGKRYVSSGRGYTYYKIPDPNIKIEDKIMRVHEKRMTGLYKYGEDTLAHGIKQCLHCLTPTKMICERCHAPYCSKDCQVSDWPRHKVECDPIPALIKKVDPVPLSRSSSEEQIPNSKKLDAQRMLRRPRKYVEALQKTTKDVSPDQHKTHMNNSSAKDIESIKTMDKQKCMSTENTNLSNISLIKEVHDVSNKSNEKLLNKTENIKQNESRVKPTQDIEKKETHNSVSTLYSNKQKEHFKDKISQEPKKCEMLNQSKMQSNYSSQIDNVKVNDNEKDTFLSTLKFTNVKLVWKSEDAGVYWVHKVEDETALQDMMMNLQTSALQAQRADPVIGGIYAVQFEDIWHRGVVISLNPIKVHYIDYGNDNVLERNDCRIIGNSENIPGFARKIRLSQNAQKQYKNIQLDDILCVKMIAVDSAGVISVQIQDEKVSVECINTTESELSSAVDTLTVGSDGMLEVHAVLSNNVYGITLLPKHLQSSMEEILFSLPNECDNMQESVDYNPKINDLICGQRDDGDWLRGRIINLKPILRISAIDEARTTLVKKVVPYPKKFLNICTFGAICEVTDSHHQLKGESHCPFEVIACNKNANGTSKIEIMITYNNVKFKAVVKPWKLLPEQKGVLYAELKSGSEVCLTSFSSQYTLFARPLDTDAIEYFNQIMQSIAKCAQSAAYLKEPPVIGQMVIARYIDDNHYRAIVTKVRDEKVAISYVDFGNTEVTTIHKLQILSNDLKQRRSCTAKITLKDVPCNIPMTKEVSDYLGSLVGKEVPLKCVYEGEPSTDGVQLKLVNGESVNDKVVKLLTPSWEKEDRDDNVCYMLQDMDVVKLGKVGEIVDALILCSMQDGYKYVMCPNDTALITHITDIMPSSMNKYCANAEHYIPREHELCLALYQGDWYRAACICPNQTSTTATVFFIDFGNMEIVSHKDIRLMKKDFLTPGALGSICNVVNLAPVNAAGQYSTKVLERIAQLIVPTEVIKIKITKIHKTEEYDIELPRIREILMKENLIPSS